MSYKDRNIDVGQAVTDLTNRTLSRLPSDFSRLVYLASSRDYNNGQYYHDGLAFHFSESVASRALAECHREIFARLVYASLEELIAELRNYISSTDERPEDFLKSWEHLGSYRITIPSECDELEAQVFLSNLKMALAILQARQKHASRDEQSA
jgi:hypothetical protein